MSQKYKQAISWKKVAQLSGFTGKNQIFKVNGREGYEKD